MLSRLTLLPFVLVALSLAACSTSPHASSRISMPTVVSSGPARIAIDGDITDWPTDDAFYANADFLYFRFMVQDQLFTLQAAPSPVTLFLDTDSDAATGRRFTQSGIQEIGADLEIVFSPKETNGKGAAAFVLDSAGTRSRVKTTDLDLLFAPTYASQWYEGRISRRLNDVAGLPRAGLASEGAFAGFVTFGETSGKLAAYSDPSRGTLVPVHAEPSLATLDLPKKPVNAIRVISWNVENTSPIKKPGAFRNVLQLLDPDVVLVQEWDEGNAEAVKGWFTAMVPFRGEWSVVKGPGDKSNGGGVAVVSKHEATLVDLGRLMTEGDRASPSRPVRFIAATVATPLGTILVGSTHLKSGGSKDSSEDRRRVAEARAIQAKYASASASLPANSIRLIAGDMNLVGSRPPLDILRAGLDADGSELDVVHAWPVGDDAMYTWMDDFAPFTPGRLDYVVYSDSTAKIVNAFIFNTRRVSDESLARMGMARDDSECSDHLPVVVDFQWRN